MPHQLVVPLTDQAGDYDGSYGVIIADAIKIEQIANPPGTSQAEIHYIHSDHLNTPQRMTDSTQQTVWAADYQPFGQATLTTASITNPLRFPGQYYDEETNLHYNYFRDYDPTTGRYIQSDPIGLGGGLNTYGYVVNNPVNLSDPLGLIICAKDEIAIPDPNNPGVAYFCKPKNKNSPPSDRCGTVECAAGILPNPTDIRSVSQVECDSCKFICKGAIAMGTPLPIGLKKALISGVGTLSADEICTDICSDECKDCGK